MKKIFCILLILFFSCDKNNQLPNVVLILTDDLGYNDVGFNGSTEIFTPNIDKIASNGVLFKEGYVSYPVCGPSRAGLITGRYQDTFGFGKNPLFTPKDPNMGLPLTEQTMADMLKLSDYRTFAVGKWHLGAHESLRPLKRGFDEFFGFLTGGHRYFPEDWTLADETEVKSQGQAYRTKLLRNDERIEEKEYLTDALSRESVDFIDRNSEKPFFIYLAYNAPHGPLQATKEYLDRYDHIDDENRKTYAAMVSAVDDGVGIIIKALRDKGIEENTIIVFLSDNGGAHNNSSSNYPLKGTKGSVYEGGLRVPFAIQWKGVIPPNTIYENSISSLDIMATMADILKIKKNKKMPLDGVNIIPYLTGEKKGEPHKYLFWRKWEQGAMAVIRGNFKLLKNNKQSDFELYNLKIDISESNNLIGTKPNLEKDLKEKWNIWNKGLKDRYYPSLGNDNWWERVYKYENQD